MNTPWIGVDLDGTLAHYDGWVASDVIGAPVPLMLERVKRWLSEGADVRIFTARVACGTDVAEIVRAKYARLAIINWCKMHLGREIPVTNVKDMNMLALYDDRAVHVIPNTGIIIEEIAV